MLNRVGVVKFFFLIVLLWVFWNVCMIDILCNEDVKCVMKEGERDVN